MQLPGDKIKQIGAHRKPAVREVERLDRAIAQRIGKRLQENMADFHVVNPLDKFIDVVGLLGRIGIVDIIEIDVHDAHGIGLLNLADRAGKGFERGISGNQKTRNIAEIAHICQPILKGKSQLITLLSGDGERCAVRGAIGPDPGAGRFSRHPGNFVGNFAHVISDPLVELPIGFIAARRFIVKAVGDGGFTASLWVSRYAVMRSPGMRANLNQRRLA